MRSYYDKPKDLNSIIFIDGQMCVWDDSPAISFGQIWMPVCIWCRRGPLNFHTGLTCPDCSNKSFEYLDDIISVWNTVRKYYTYPEDPNLPYYAKKLFTI